MARQQKTARPARRNNRQSADNALNEEVSQTPQVGDASSNKTEDIRGNLARVYVWAFVIISGGGLAYTLLYGYTISDIKDVLLAISGLLSGPLGFIFGFYFKEQQQK